MREVCKLPMSDESVRLYPDIAVAQGLGNALQAALAAIGSDLRVTGLPEKAQVLAYARVAAGQRFSQVYIVAKERLFLSDFWSRGVALARASTPHLEELAGAINRWVGSNCTTTELASRFDFVSIEPTAASYESGQEVEHRWRNYLESIPEHLSELSAFVQAASRSQELRRLFPYTSLNTFCFSRCTGYPFSGDTPRVSPLADGQYEVHAPGRKLLGSGDAEAAVRLVVEHLPPNCGSAVAGTVEDLPR